MEKISILLAVLRLAIFGMLSASCFNLLPLSLFLQVFLSSGVIISDILDGKISRKNNNEENKVRFRKIDTFVDKIGILSCAIGLCVTGKLPISIITSILTYNTIIIAGGLVKVKLDKNLNEKKISGNIFSRSANLLTAITFLLANNNLLITSLVQNLIFMTLISSYGISLGNHYKLIKKNKEIKNYTNSDITISTNNISYQEKNKQPKIVKSKNNYRNNTRQNLIKNLKWYRQQVVIENDKYSNFENLSDENINSNSSPQKIKISNQ